MFHKTKIFMDMKLIDILKENKALVSNILENDEMGEPVQSEKDTQVINDLEREIESTDVNQDDDSLSIPNNTVRTEYKFRVSSEYSLRQAIETIKKMSKKYKVPEPIINVGEKKREGFGWNEIWGTFSYYLDLIPVTVTVENIFKLQGLDVLAIVDNTTGGSVRIGDEPVPSEMLTPSSECHLCNVNRYRGKSYLVKDTATGEIKRFGGDCVKKVFGINPAKFIAAIAFYERMDAGFDFDPDSEPSGGGRRGISPLLTAVPIPLAMAVVKFALDQRGYVKKEGEYISTGSGWGAREEYHRTNKGKATADLCEDILFSEDEMKKFKPVNELTEKVKTYWESVVIKDPNSGFGQFLQSVKDILSSGEFRVIDCSKLIYAVHEYTESLTRAEKSNEYIGTVGEKLLFTDLKLLNHKSFQSQFGMGHIWSFEDSLGNKVKKFGELNSAFRTAEGTEQLFGEYNKGDMFTFIADVKNHEEYNGVKSTLLGRLSKPAPAKKLKEELSEQFNRFAKY